MMMPRKISAEDILRDLHEETKNTDSCVSRSRVGGACWSFCRGPSQPPKHMQTCPLCWQVWRIKQYFNRKERRMGKQLALGFGLVLALLTGVASADACPKGRKSVVKREPDRVVYACADKAGLWQGLGTVKDPHGNLLAVGKFKDGQPEGVWSRFQNGHVVAHPMYHLGVVVASDTMQDDEAGGAGADD